MNTFQINPGPRGPETVKVDGELLTEVKLEANLGGKSQYKFYSYGEGRVLSVVRFIKEDGEEIASYGPVADRKLGSIALSLFNAGAIDSTELPGEVRRELETAVL